MIGRPSIGMVLGRPQRTALLARKLRARGFHVTHYDTRGFDGDRWVAAAGGFRCALAQRVLRSDHDVYFTGLGFAPSFSLYLNRVLRAKPYVFVAAGVPWKPFRGRARNRLFRRTVERRIHPLLLDRVFAGASRIVCNSRFLRAALAASFPQHRYRLTTIYDGVDLERSIAGRRTRVTGTDPGDFVLLFVTALDDDGKSQALDLVLEAFARVRETARPAKLVVAARASSPLYRQRAAAAVSASRARDSIALRLDIDDVPDLLASSDLYVHATPASSSDTLPRALLEAQAAGLPAVTTDTVGCAEIVRDGETGRVVATDAGAMADAILGLMDSREALRPLGENARSHVRDTFNPEVMADRYSDVFVEVVR